MEIGVKFEHCVSHRVGRVRLLADPVALPDEADAQRALGPGDLVLVCGPEWPLSDRSHTVDFLGIHIAGNGH